MSVFKHILAASGGSFTPKVSLSSTDLNIIFDGDSLTEGINNSGVDQYYPKQVEAYLTPLCQSLTFNSFGVSGQTTQNMLSDLSTQITPLYDPNKVNVIIAWEDVNAILNGLRTSAQNISDFETYFSICKSAGFEHTVLITGYYPRRRINGTYNQSGWDQGNPSPLDNQHEYFETVKNNGISDCDVIVDLRDESTIGGAREQTLVNQTYFEDSVHLQDLGYDLVADFVIQNGIFKRFKL